MYGPPPQHYYIPQMQDLCVSVICMSQILQFIPDAFGISPSSGQEFYLTTWPTPEPKHTEQPTVPKGTCAFCEVQPLVHGTLSPWNVLPTFSLPGRCLPVCWDSFKALHPLGCHLYLSIRLLPTIIALLFIHSLGWAFGDSHYSTSYLMVVYLKHKHCDS